MDRFAPLKTTGQLARIDPDLTGKYGRSAAVISRIIPETIREGSVEVIVQEARIRPPVRNRALENDLKRHFNQLQDVRVIETPPLDPSLDAKERGRLDDELHEALGQVAAEFIAGQKFLFSNGDSVGVGSGRGVSYTITALRRFPHLRVSVTLVGLTGAVNARDHAGRTNVNFDADSNLGQLAPCFEQRVKLEQISHPMAFGSDRDLRRAWERTPLYGKNWTTLCPTSALVGVGVLGPGNRFYEEVKKEPRNRTRLVEPIIELLEQLVARSEEIQAKYSPTWFPVVDVCNRLHYLPPPETIDVSGEMRVAELEALVQKTNRRLLTITDEQLQEIPNILLIAGTERKASAVQSLLAKGRGQTPRYNISFLATDARTAMSLLEEVPNRRLILCGLVDNSP